MRKTSIFLLIVLVGTFLISLKPESKFEVTPAEFGLKYRDVEFKTADGLTLKGWYFNPKTQSGTVVILSHDGEGNMAKMIELASYFTTLGVNVLTYDYRGFGSSDVFEINQKFFIYGQFEKDLTAAVDFTKKLNGISQVFLYGKGMGAGLSIGVGAARRDVMKVIADCPYTNLNDFQKKYKEVKGEDILIPLAFNKEMLEPQYALAGKFANLTKFLFVYGDKDLLYTTKDMKELAKINKDQTETYVVKGADYSSTFSTNKEAYFEQIKAFIK